MSAAEAPALIFTPGELLPTAVNLESVFYKWHFTGTGCIKPASYLANGLPTVLY